MLLPTNFLIVLGLAGALLLLARFAALGRKLLVVSAVLLAVCGFSPLGNILLYPLEQRFPPWDAAQGPPDGIIVLGGPIDADLSVAHDTPVIRSAPDRMIAAAALAHQYPNARIVFSGGSANLIANDAREADFAGEIFEGLGIDKSRLTMERRSRNTYENAEFFKTIATPKPGEFRKAGFAVEPYPVDWRVGGRADLLSFTNFAGDGLGRTDTAVREWLGLVAYRLTGSTGELLPGPAKD